MRLYGSTDLFPDDLRDAFRPAQSVNYIDSHDGFCLYDLVSYTNTDQTSWGCGFEGDEGVLPDVAQLRRQQVKNFCALLLLSNGTPMFCAGDEFLRTQQGDPNPWNQDNSKSWLDWTFLEQNQDVFRFFQLMIQFRKDHPALARSIGWREHVRWYGTSSTPDTSSDSHSLAFFLVGSDMGDSDFYVLINAGWEPLTFCIQQPGQWSRVVDTSLTSGQDIALTSDAIPLTGAAYPTNARSIVVLVR
jgi:glycogen operon protein